MGFIGSMRKIIKGARVGGKFNPVDASSAIIKEAQKAKFSNLSSFFSTKFVTAGVDNKGFIGALDADTFVRAARNGDYRASFARAFNQTGLLENSTVRNTVSRALQEARTTLPDFKYARNVESIASAKRVLKVGDTTINTVDGLSTLATKNRSFKSAMNKLTVFVKRQKKMRLFGYTLLFSAAVITPIVIYQRAVEEAEKLSGCFLYYATSSGGFEKCKISRYSCANGSKGMLCSAELMTPAMRDNTDCQNNPKEECLHCDVDDEINADIGEDQKLVCEHPTALDIIIDSITNTVGDVWSGLTGIGGNLLKYGAIIIGVLFLIVIAFNFFFK